MSSAKSTNIEKDIHLSIPITYDYKKFYGWDKFFLDLFSRLTIFVGVLAGTAVSILLSAIVVSPLTDNPWAHNVPLILAIIAGVYFAHKIGIRILDKKEAEKNDYREKVAFPQIINEFEKLGWTLDDFTVGMLVNQQSANVQDAHGVTYSFRHFTIYANDITVYAVLTDKSVLAKIKEETELTQDEKDFAEFSSKHKNQLGNMTPAEIFFAARH
jgi:hypothetical protein